MWTVAASLWEDFIDPLKVTFDAANRRIIVNPQFSNVDMKIDVYSAYKRWFQRRDNAKYLPPLRTTGGDPVGGGMYAGDMYFLINDWQMVVTTLVKINGILYQDNPTLEAYVILPGGGVQSTVSSLAYAYTTTGVTVPTVGEISAEVWNAASSTFNTDGTLGAQLNKAVQQTSTVTTDLQTINTKLDGQSSSNVTEFQTVNMKLDSLPVGVSAQIVVDLQDEITAINSIPTLHSEIAAVPGAIRTELTSELNHLASLQNGQGLDSTQATMLLEIYRLYGLDPTIPLVVNMTNVNASYRQVGDITQSITVEGNKTTVSRT